MWPLDAHLVAALGCRAAEAALRPACGLQSAAPSCISRWGSRGPGAGSSRGRQSQAALLRGPGRWGRRPCRPRGSCAIVGALGSIEEQGGCALRLLLCACGSRPSAQQLPTPRWRWACVATVLAPSSSREAASQDRRRPAEATRDHQVLPHVLARCTAESAPCGLPLPVPAPRPRAACGTGLSPRPAQP